MIFAVNTPKAISNLELVDIMRYNTVADPGFSRWGCANSEIGIILQIFCRKLHENERIWTPGSGGRVPGAPLDPPM